MKVFKFLTVIVLLFGVGDTGGQNLKKRGIDDGGSISASKIFGDEIVNLFGGGESVGFAQKGLGDGQSLSTISGVGDNHLDDVELDFPGLGDGAINDSSNTLGTGDGRGDCNVKYIRSKKEINVGLATKFLSIGDAGGIVLVNIPGVGDGQLSGLGLGDNGIETEAEIFSGIGDTGNYLKKLQYTKRGLDDGGAISASKKIGDETANLFGVGESAGFVLKGIGENGSRVFFGLGGGLSIIPGVGDGSIDDIELNFPGLGGSGGIVMTTVFGIEDHVIANLPGLGEGSGFVLKNIVDIPEAEEVYLKNQKLDKRGVIDGGQFCNFESGNILLGLGDGLLSMLRFGDVNMDDRGFELAINFPGIGGSGGIATTNIFGFGAGNGIALPNIWGLGDSGIEAEAEIFPGLGDINNFLKNYSI